jgi:hypothetical protein
MTEVLKRIKRLILVGRYVFTEKAIIERERDQLSEEDILESIMNAQDIYKTINSRNPYRRGQRDKLYSSLECLRSQIDIIRC